MLMGSRFIRIGLQTGLILFFIPLPRVKKIFLNIGIIFLNCGLAPNAVARVVNKINKNPWAVDDLQFFFFLRDAGQRMKELS